MYRLKGLNCGKSCANRQMSMAVSVDVRKLSLKPPPQGQSSTSGSAWPLPCSSRGVPLTVVYYDKIPSPTFGGGGAFPPK